jgi:hypothetical protein
MACSVIEGMWVVSAINHRHANQTGCWFVSRSVPSLSSVWMKNLRPIFFVFSLFLSVGLGLGFVSSVALLKIAEMEYCGTNSYFLKLLLDKKYALPYRVLDAVLLHFVRFTDDDRDLPVIWHQSLLTFVQR